MRVGRCVGAGGLASALVLGGHALAGGQTEPPPGCVQPYPPAYAQQGYPTNDPAPTLNATSVVMLPPDHFIPADLDGDGSPDVEQPLPTAPGQHIPPTVHRPAGDITLDRAGVDLTVLSVGDLDGDPGQELWVLLSDPARTHGDPIAVEAYVVPYGAPSGTHDPADVGIRVEAGVPFPVPDRTGDGVADVLDVDTPSPDLLGGTTRVLSGAAILAAGVGGDSRPAATVDTVAGAAHALAAFGGPQPAIITLQDISDTDLEVRVFDGGVTTVFTNRPQRVGFIPAEIRRHSVDAFAGPGGRFISVSADSRSGGGTYWWSLDDPCSPLRVGGLPASQPATPVPGAPRYTG